MSFGIRIRGIGGPTGGGLTPDTRTIAINGLSLSNPVFGDENVGSDRIIVVSLNLFINADPGQFIDTETILYLYTRGSRRGEDIVLKESFRSVYSEILNNDWLASEANQEIDSPEKFQGEDLIFLMGGTSEFSRIKAVTPPEIISYSNPVNVHAQNSGISKVLELGNFNYFDRGIAQLLRWRVETLSPIAANYTMVVEYLNI